MTGPACELATLLFNAPRIGWLGSFIIALSAAAAVLAYTTGLRWRQSSQPTRFTLLALRCGAVVCLFLTLMHPAWVKQRTILERPILAVVLDDSASMARSLSARGRFHGSSSAAAVTQTVARMTHNSSGTR